MQKKLEFKIVVGLSSLKTSLKSKLSVQKNIYTPNFSLNSGFIKKSFQKSNEENLALIIIFCLSLKAFNQ